MIRGREYTEEEILGRLQTEAGQEIMLGNQRIANV